MSAAIPLLALLDPRPPEAPRGGRGRETDRFPTALEVELSREPEAPPEPDRDPGAEPSEAVPGSGEAVVDAAGRDAAAVSVRGTQTPQDVDGPLPEEITAGPQAVAVESPPQTAADREAVDLPETRWQARVAGRLPLPLDERAPASPVDSRAREPQVDAIGMEPARSPSPSLPQSPVPAESAGRAGPAEPAEQGERAERLETVERPERDRLSALRGGPVPAPAQSDGRPEVRGRAIAESAASPPVEAERAQQPGPDALSRRADSRSDSATARIAAGPPPAKVTERPRDETEGRGRDPETPDRLAALRAGRRAPVQQAAEPEPFRAVLADAPKAAAPAEPSAGSSTPALAPAELRPVVAPPVAPAPAAHAAPEAIPLHAEWLAARGGGVARLSLHPPELGGLQLQVRVRGNSVEIVIVAEESAARAIAHEYRDQLVQSLASRDLRMDHFEVRAASGDDAAPGRDGPRDGAGAAGDGGRGADASGDGRDAEPGGAPLRATRREPETQPQPQTQPPRTASAERVDLRI